MKINPDEIREFLDLLEQQPPEHWGLIRKTVLRYGRGEVPELIDTLLRNPDLTAALLRCGQRRLRRLEREAGDRE